MRDIRGGAILTGALTLAAVAVVAVPPAGAAPAPAARAAAKWTKVALPNLGADSGLKAVKAFSGKDAWAIGWKTSYHRGLVLRWNGKKWSEATGLGSGFYHATAVAGSSGTDVWVSGACNVPWDVRLTCVVRWNGKSWQRFVLPAPPGGFIVDSISAISRNDAWISGHDSKTAYFLHWNGVQWSPVGSPAPPADRTYKINDLAAAGAKDIWAVGSDSDGADSLRPLILHWNGKIWSRHASDLVPDGRLDTVAALPKKGFVAGGTNKYAADPNTSRLSGGVWQRWSKVKGATGVTGLTGDGNGGLVAATTSFSKGTAHYGLWNGKTWTTIEGATRPTDFSVEPYDVALVPGTKSVWSVGSHFKASHDGYQAFIEVYGPVPH